MSASVKALCWAILMFVMIYPHKHFLGFPLENRAVQACAFGLCMVILAFARHYFYSRAKLAQLRTIILNQILIAGVTLIVAAGISEIIETFEPHRLGRLLDFTCNSLAVLATGILGYGVTLVLLSDEVSYQGAYDALMTRPDSGRGGLRPR